MKKTKRTKIIRTLLVTLLFVCATFLFASWQYSKRLSEKIDMHKLKYEALLAEKLLLKKNQLKDSSTVRKFSNSVLSLTRQLSLSTKELTNVHGTNLRLKTNNKKLRDTLYKTISTAKVLKLRYASMKDSLSMSTATNRILSDSIGWLANVSARYKEELENAMIRSIDQTLVSCVKANNELTVRARKTKHINARVELPGHLSNLSLRIEGEDKSFLASKSTITSKVIDKKNKPWRQSATELRRVLGRR
jgi:regulator of replication initiation timing